MADWFSQLANQALKLADDFTDSLVAQASEAQDQIQREQQKLREEEENKRQLLSSGIQLPWETEDESLQILSDALMDSILKLSLNDKNFTEKSPNSDDVHFVFSDFIATAMRLLQLDANLANVHSRISPRMDEELFWRNYYCRVIYLRAMCGIDGPAAQERMKSQWGSTDRTMVFDVDSTTESQKRGLAKPQASAVEGKHGLASASVDSKRQGLADGVDDDHELLAELGLDDVDDGMDEEVNFKPTSKGGSRSGDGAQAREDKGGEEEEEAEEEDDEPLDLGDLDDMDLLDELGMGSEDGEGGGGTSRTAGSGGKDKDSGELGSYEEVGKSDCHSSSSNAELEAQIAAELANLSDDDDA